ncbi:MAG: ACT domain-containing protein [Clostridiales bacterium]|nr:ACT domain-containing protein [Clostridiales bacterium]
MVKQIAVFLENQEGRLSDCCKVLKKAGVNLDALSIADTKEFGILRLIAEDNERAMNALKEAGFLCSLIELVAIEVPDKAGALADELIALSDNGVNIEYMYSFADKDGHAQIAFKTVNPEKAVEVLKNAGAKVL